MTVMIQKPADGSCAERALGTGSARRRRERRLRSFLRHERMTVRMELAAALHHSSFRGAGPEMYDAPRSQRTANSRVGLAEYYELFSDDGRPTGRERPGALLEPWPQGMMERHDGIAYELVQALDAPVLQTVEQLLNVVQFFATQLPVVAEPVIAVPKILPHDVPPRRLCRDTQLALQPGGSAHDSLLPQAADSRADRGQPSSAWWSWSFPEVFKAFSLDTVRRSGLRTRLLTFQLRAVVSGVFKVFSQNRVQLRRLWNAFLSGMWSRSLFLGLVKAFKIFAQD